MTALFEKAAPKLERPGRLERVIGNTMWTPLHKIIGSPDDWMMRCKCGTEKTVKYQNYLRGLSLSCGCYRRALGNRGGNRLPVGESAKNQLLLIYKRGAAKRGLSFELTRDEFVTLTSANCSYCGFPPHQLLDREKYTGKGNGAYIYNGIDRVDPHVGYTLSNCVSCCRMCNYAKSDMSQAEFIEWLDGVATFRADKQGTRRAS